MPKWYEYQKEYLDKLAELEKREIERKKKQKAIEESLKTQEVFISSETQEKLEKQIQESLILIEDLNETIRTRKEDLKTLNYEILNAIEQLKNQKQELAMNRDFQLALAKIQKGIAKRKKLKSQNPSGVA